MGKEEAIKKYMNYLSWKPALLGINDVMKEIIKKTKKKATKDSDELSPTQNLQSKDKRK